MKVEYIDHLGTDLTVCNAARVSFDKTSDWEYGPYCEQCNDHHGPYLSDKDKKLIHYLAKHNHFTPFTHCVITLRETVPIFVARQRFKHTVGFTYNEVSRRYVDDAPEFYVPDVWRKRAENVKQGSSDEAVNLKEFWANGEPDDEKALVWPFSLDNQFKIVMRDVEALYYSLLKAGVAPEQARMVLPQSMYTSYYVTGSLSAFARAYNLRSDSHAQKEIQELAISWKNIIEPLFPESWKALTNDQA